MLAGTATGEPIGADGKVEMMRTLRGRLPVLRCCALRAFLLLDLKNECLFVTLALRPFIS